MRINTYDYAPIGQRIKLAREAKGCTQAQLGEIIDISTKNIGTIERGINDTSISSLIAICKALNVDANYILFGVKHETQNTAINNLLSQLSPKKQIYAEKLIQTYVDSCKDES